MKKMTMILAAVISFNTSFAFANLSPSEAIILRTEISSLQLDKDRLQFDLNRAAMQIQALDDIANPTLETFYREYRNTINATTTLSGIVATLAYLARQGGDYNRALGHSNGPSALIAAAILTISAGGIVSTILTDKAQASEFSNIVALYKSLEEKEQAAEFVVVSQNIVEMKGKIAALDVQISALTSQLN